MLSKDLIYSNSPWWAQNIYINVWAYAYFHNPKFKKYLKIHRKLLDKTVKFSKDELLQFSFNKFQALLNYCNTYVPFYRNKWRSIDFNPSYDIQNPDDINLIPLLSKNDVRENYNELFSEIAYKYNPIYSNTSGTTGTPLHFAISLETKANYCAVLERYRKWYNYNSKKWTASVGGKEIIGKSRSGPLWRYCIPFQTMSGMSRLVIYDSLHINMTNVKKYVKHMKKIGISYLKGYPTNLYEFAKLLIELEENLPIEVVFTGSEPLHDFIEDMLIKKFNVDSIADFYGNSECVAYSHKHPNYQDYFIPLDSVWLEIVNPINGNEASTVGEVVGTNFYNYVMPLVRYRTGDNASFVNQQSNLPFPSMSRVYSKYEDVVFTKDNSVISPSSLTHPFKSIPPLIFERTQIVQKQKGYLTINYIPGKKFNAKVFIDIINKFNERFNNRFVLNFEKKDNIKKNKSGKYRWVINEINSHHKN